MNIFYVRPERAGGYGKGDGASYEDAWNGFAAVDWQAMSAAEAATLWVCGPPGGTEGFLTVQLEWGYLKHSKEAGFEPATRSHPRRELTEPV
jgi:hypothetical protein